MNENDGNDPVGSVGVEAAKLLTALQGWARESGSDYTHAAAHVASSGASSLSSINEHIATGSAECRYCPLCQIIAAARKTSPEVKEHLATAATSFLQAGMAILATHVSDPGESRRDSGVEKIDLSDGDGWEDE